jgi:hypothetical protein
MNLATAEPEPVGLHGKPSTVAVPHQGIDPERSLGTASTLSAPGRVSHLAARLL